MKKKKGNDAVVSRKRRENKVLAKASEHLHYEWLMLCETANRLAADSFEDNTSKNAFLESFTIHARALLHFLFPEGAPLKYDDVIAQDYVNN
jgi:hypothetical protein